MTRRPRSSDLAVSSQHGTALARGQVIHAARSGSLPRLSVSSDLAGSLHTRRSLRALGRVTQALAQESERLQHRADFGRLAAPSH